MGPAQAINGPTSVIACRHDSAPTVPAHSRIRRCLMHVTVFTLRAGRPFSSGKVVHRRVSAQTLARHSYTYANNSLTKAKFASLV